MNVNEFVACRTPELNRFVKILEEKKEEVPLRLRTPHPIRPGAFVRVSAHHYPLQQETKNSSSPQLLTPKVIAETISS